MVRWFLIGTVWLAAFFRALPQAILLRLKQPQWGSRRVSGVIRLGAAVFVALGALVGGIAVEHFIASRSLPALSFGTIFNLTAGPYLWCVFLRVAITGQAPTTWVPWR